MKKRKDLLEQYKAPWLIYILVSILLAFLLRWVITSKATVLFWTYFGVMGVSALITKWFYGEEHTRKWILWVEHISMVTGMSLFMWGILNWLLG